MYVIFMYTITNMFEGLFKSKFYTKCKSNIELTKTRLELIKKNRNAMLKYLRRDVSELLKNGFDVHAYSRVEGVLVLLIKSECYEFVEKCCVDVSSHLTTMDKQRECPEDCKEAVSSLMHAAAWFADLPELRELRTLFSRKYSNSIDCFVNKEFAEKLKSGLPSKDDKIQLLQEIAFEHGLQWNSKALENEFLNERKQVDKFQHKSPIDKDSIQVDTITRIENQDNKPLARNLDHEEAEGDEQDEEDQNKKKPIQYGLLIPPPYTKSRGDRHESDYHHNNKQKLANKEKAEPAQRILNFFDNGNNNNNNIERDQSRDEDETILDKLLRLYYSRKRGAHHERAKSEPALKLPLEKSEYSSTSSDSELEREASNPNGSSRGHARASSLGHVHPKLPDYDDFVAKLTELKRK